MANLGDLAGLLTKTVRENSGTIASTVNKVVQKVQTTPPKPATPAVQPTPPKPVPIIGDSGKSDPASTVLRAPQATDYKPDFNKIIPTIVKATTGIKPETTRAAMQVATEVPTLIKQNAEKNKVIFDEYYNTQYLEDAKKYGGGTGNLVQAKELFKKVSTENREQLFQSAYDKSKKASDAQKLANDKAVQEYQEASRGGYALPPEMIPFLPVRKYVSTPEAEREQLIREALIDIPAGVFKGFLGGRSYGVTDMLAGQQSSRLPASFKENKQLQDTGNFLGAAASGFAGFIGGAKTYGAVANKISSTLAKAPVFGAIAKNHPIFTSYVLQNLGEEMFEASVRKGTGQEYGATDFVIGMLLGGAFQGTSDVVKHFNKNKVKVLANLEQGLKSMEEAKGDFLTKKETENVVMNMPIGNNFYGRDLFREARMVGLTGGRKGRPGIDYPAPLPTKPVDVMAESMQKPLGQKVEQDFIAEADQGFKGQEPLKQPQKESFDVDGYIGEQIAKRDLVKKGSRITDIKQKVGDFYTEIKAKIIDSSAPMEDMIRSAQAQGKYEILPKYDLTNQIDRVLLSPRLAGQFLEDKGLATVIKEVPDLNKLDQYLIAKQSLRLAEKGIDTGRNLAKDRALITALDSEYGNYAKEVTEYSKKVLDYSVESGLISEDLSKKLKEIYPDYVPIKRVFDELEKIGGQPSGKSVASLSKQTVVERIEGSDKEIENPIESLVIKTNDAFTQGEKNKAAKILTGMRDLPGFEGKFTELKDGESAPFTISYLENGVKKTFKTTKIIADSAKRINAEQAGLLIKILRFPVRVFKAGTTGLEPSFVAANLVKDQFTAFINSKNGLATSIANPRNFTEALFSTLKHDDLYKEFVRAGGGGTSFDVNRSQVTQTVDRIRAGRSKAETIKYTIKHPSEMFRAIEDIFGTTEQMTRVSQFRGTKEALLKEGRNMDNATILASKAARENTANFYRKGEWGDVLNTIPYFNASVQGSRALIRSFRRDPASTTFKIAATMLLPMAVTTAWNTMDPERKKVYDDILDYEKEGNFIIIPPNPTKDEKTGKWNVIKVPMTPGVSELTIPVRKAVEGAYQEAPTDVFGDFASSLIGAVSPISLDSPSKTLGNLTPQLLKPALEVAANRDFFRETPIIPLGKQGLSPELQVRENSSEAAKIIGGILNMSPIQVDHLFAGYGGKLATQVVGGMSPLEAVSGRFTKAVGGKEIEKIYGAKNEAETENRDVNYLLKESVDTLLEAKDKEGMAALYEALDDDKKSYVKEYIKDKVTTNPDKNKQIISELNAPAAIKYYGAELDEAIKSKDQAKMLEMISSLGSDKAKKEFLKHIIARKAELSI